MTQPRSEDALFDPFRPQSEAPMPSTSGPIDIESPAFSLWHTATTTDTCTLQAPRLSIAHFLLWITCCAVLLSLQRFTEPAWVRELDFETPLSLTLWQIANLLVASPGVAACCVALSRWLRGWRFPTQPGESLLILAGLTYLAFLVLEIAAARQLIEIDVRLHFVYGFQLAIAALYFVVGTLQRMPWRWWMSVYASGIPPIIVAVQGVLMWWLRFYLDFAWAKFLGGTFLLALLVRASCVVFAVAIDRRRHVRRGWLHAVGVCVVLAQTALIFVAQWI